MIVLTGHGDTQVALDAMKAGADDFVTKPYEPDHLRFLVQRILERRRLIDELEQLRKQMREDYSFHNMVSKSPKMRRIFDLIEQVGPLGSTVLIYGETGTGKELVAQAIHAADNRRKGPFVALNCAVAARLAAGERAVRPRARGRSPAPTAARRGGSSWPTAAPCSSTRSATSRRRCRRKLLRVLQSGTFERVGGTETIKVDVRIVAATQQAAGGRGQGRPVPLRPVLPPERDPDRPARRSATGPRTSRCWRCTSSRSSRR